MLTTLLAAFALGIPQTPNTFNIEPSDNVWVYAHASDPSNDPYLRCWGAEAKSVAPSPSESDEFSYSYLKFDLSALPKNGKLTEAKLTFTHIPNPGFTADYAKANPLEVRQLIGDFSEKTWTYDNVDTVNPNPSEDGLYGWGVPDSFPANGEDFTITVDLMKSDHFSKALSEAEGKGNAISVAIASAMDPSAMGQKSVYKVYSKYGPSGKHPVLHLVFAD